MRLATTGKLDDLAARRGGPVPRWINRTALAAAAVLLGTLSCGDDGTTEPPVPVATTVTVTPDSVELAALEDTEQLTAQVLDQNGWAMAGASVSWSSGDTAVAVVDTAGLVMATGNGLVAITATAGSASGSATVTVEQVVSGTIAIAPAVGTLALGDTLRLVAEAVDGNGHPIEEFTWSSSDARVAHVDGSGLVRGVGEGTATIAATAGDAQGSAEIAVEDPDRAALVALYEATDGPNWVNSENWLTDMPVGEWHGVRPDHTGRVYTLTLANNNLTGPIAPELGNLANLTMLILWNNNLTGTVPAELGNLTNVWYLNLASNNLTGPIPAELGNLAILRRLNLDNNSLSGPISPELGDLAKLRYLTLNHNSLSGPIPPELGDLAKLWRLNLDNNSLSGPIPPEFAGMSSLRFLHLASNPGLGGALPSEMTSLDSLDMLLTSGTGLCAPANLDFRSWLGGMALPWIGLCTPHPAYLTQAVQSLEFPVPLVAGEKALLRVFPTARRETEAGIPLVRARFYLNGRETHGVDIPGRSTPVPTEIDEGDLAKSANAEIPGRVVRPGLEIVIEIDPDSTLDPRLGVTGRVPEEGRLAVEVGAMPVFDLTLIPFVWTETHDSSIVETVGEMEEDRESHELFADMRLLPVGRMDVTAHAPVLSSSNNAVDLFYETIAIRAMEGGTGHYKGMMSPPVTGPSGVAHRGRRVSFSSLLASTIAHELGHNFILQHAPCGRPSGVDPLFPYPDGSIGAWGYDFRLDRLVQSSRSDLMSYCFHQWISDYHFITAFRFRLSDEGGSVSAIPAAPRRSILLWGGVAANTVPFLEPTFVVEAPRLLPDSAGDWRLAGRTSDGTELFSLSFAMPAIADADGQSGFVFVLPVEPSWEASLAAVTLAGPAGSVTLDGDSDMPMAILRDAATGQVRAVLRDPSAATLGAMDAAGPPGADLKVLFSRGIPGVEAWRR